MKKKENASQSVFWSGLERILVQGISFVLSIVIARLILPEEYGLIAMLTIFIQIAQTFIDSGFSNALIQKQDRTNVDYSTVFYFNLIVAICAYFILFFCSTWIAAFYNEPILEPLTRWCSLSIILASLTIVHRAVLTIRHDFKTQAIISSISVVLSGILGVYFAYNGYGVWALVVQSISNQLLSSILFLLFTHWRPSLVFSYGSFKNLFSYGSKLLASGLLQTIYSNVYTILIGKIYSPIQLGYYGKANSLSSFGPINVSSILNRAIFPYQCEIQSDREMLAAVFNKFFRLTAFITIPFCVLLILIAKPLILLLLTEKWLPIVGMMQILIISYMFYPISNVDCQILNVCGRTDLFLKTEVVKKIIAVACMVIAIPFGIDALCWSMVINMILGILITIPYMKNVITIGYLSQFKMLLPSIAISLLAYFLVIVFNNVIHIFGNIFLILIDSGLFIIIFYIVSRLSRRVELEDIKYYTSKIYRK